MVNPPIHPSLLLRRIIHLDMDAFYAAVEIRDQPELRGKPLIVGGRPNGRGVVATCSYEARRYGVHSAMPAAHAYKLCPHAVFIKPRFQAYKDASQQVRAIMQRYSDKIEPLSLDEAYLDVTHQVQSGLTAARIAAELRKVIADELQLTASAGVAPNKMVAKIASDVNKPNGMMVVPPPEVAAFMRKLPLRKIPGIGPVTSQKLSQRGIVTCADVIARAEEFEHHEGRFQRWLWKRVQGIDERPVQTTWERKSLGHEETFAQDLFGEDAIKVKIAELAEQVRVRLKKSNVVGRTITLKVKFQNFQSVTRRQTLPEYVDDGCTIASVCQKLLIQSEIGHRPVRLLGISLSNLRRTRMGAFQPLLFSMLDFGE